MQSFAELSPQERELFLSVVSSNATKTQKTQEKTQLPETRGRKPLLPPEFSVEALYKKILDNHDSKADRLKARNEKRSRKKALQK